MPSTSTQPMCSAELRAPSHSLQLIAAYLHGAHPTATSLVKDPMQTSWTPCRLVETLKVQ